MKTKTYIWLLLYLALSACSNNEKKAFIESSKDINDSIQNNIQDSIILPGQFSFANVIAFGDSLVEYFNEYAGFNIKTYKTVIDTSIVDNYERVDIAIKTETYKTHGLISYSIYTFPTKSEAEDFFNDLKIQKLLLPWVAEKSPMFILIDSNKVYWHHLMHLYCHRIKDLTTIFNKKFNFHSKPTNLDSISNPDYYPVKDNGPLITEIYGKWKPVNPVEINSIEFVFDEPVEETNSNDCFEYISGKDSIAFKEDTMIINGIGTPLKEVSSKRLLDSRFFWKYYFQSITILDESNNTALFDKVQQLSEIKDEVYLYDIELDDGCFIHVIKLKQGKAYMVLEDTFYELSGISEDPKL